jgi:hypothetical protein
MKKLMIPAALALVIALGSYALFGQQSPTQGGHEDMMGGGINGGMMGDMSCSGCAMMPTALAATSDGGVIVAAGGKLVKYDAGLAKVAETDIDVDWDTVQKKMQQSCPMSQMMK